MNEEQTTYNGWTNRETWLVNLWIDNDQAGYGVLLEAIARKGSNFAKGEWLREQVQEWMYDLELEASLWSDLLSTAFAKVDWREIIESNAS